MHLAPLALPRVAPVHVALPAAPPASLLMLAAAASADPERALRRDLLAVRTMRSVGAGALRGAFSGPELATALGCIGVLDGAARRWVATHPRGRVVEIGAPLSTRHARLARCVPLFTSVDDAQRSALRLAIFGDTPIHQMIAAHGDRAWMRRLAREDRPLLVLVPDLLLDATPTDAVDLLVALGAELPPGTEIVAVHGAHVWPVAFLEEGEGVAIERSLGSVVRRTVLPRFAWHGRPTRRLAPGDLAVAHLVLR